MWRFDTRILPDLSLSLEKQFYWRIGLDLAVVSAAMTPVAEENQILLVPVLHFEPMVTSILPYL